MGFRKKKNIIMLQIGNLDNNLFAYTHVFLVVFFLLSYLKRRKIVR